MVATAAAAGESPTAMVLITVLNSRARGLVLITDTVLEPKLVTYARSPSGVMATATGEEPTGMVVVTVANASAFASILITVTLSEPELVTYARLPSGVIA